MALRREGGWESTLFGSLRCGGEKSLYAANGSHGLGLLSMFTMESDTPGPG
jgi:hypothetical protein